MKLRYYPYNIELKEQFRISHNSRKSTPAILVEIEQDGLIGYGEASLPPYISENQLSVSNFLKTVNLGPFNNPNDINKIIDYVNSISDCNYAAKAAIDIALHDLLGKFLKKPLYKLLHINKKEKIYSSFTIGISEPGEIKRKIKNASGFKFFKIKLGTQDDKANILEIRKITDKPLYVDVNQGWSDKYFALDMINWLSERNVILIEQPFPKNKIEDSQWLMERTPLPIIADESVQSLQDIEIIKELYSGINIKLMKAGGIRTALKMITRARELNLKIMLGCMTETSCAITAASHLSPLADWIDLDGAELISNDIFKGAIFIGGEMIIPELPGIGVGKIEI
jgi:L-alanine-DL-glutamate epimerase-like enolase superfamily enzyme